MSVAAQDVDQRIGDDWLIVYHQNLHAMPALRCAGVPGLSAATFASSAFSLGLSGRKIENTVPCSSPLLLLKRIDPPCFSTIFRVIHSPRPVPTSALVVKNGWNRSPRCSGAMPEPVSRIVTRTPFTLPSIHACEFVTLMTRAPPLGIASTAFVIRFESACRISPATALMRTWPSTCLMTCIFLAANLFS